MRPSSQRPLHTVTSSFLLQNYHRIRGLKIRASDMRLGRILAMHAETGWENGDELSCTTKVLSTVAGQLDVNRRRCSNADPPWKAGGGPWGKKCLLVFVSPDLFSDSFLLDPGIVEQHLAVLSLELPLAEMMADWHPVCALEILANSQLIA
jgi:hypothetical protein